MSVTSPSFFALRHLRVASTDSSGVVSGLLGLGIRAGLHLRQGFGHLNLSLLVQSDEDRHGFVDLVFIAELSCFLNLIGYIGRVVQDVDNHISLHRNWLAVFTLSSCVDHDALGWHVLSVWLLHVHGLHILEASRVHGLHHVVHLGVLIEVSHVVSVVELG